MRHVIWAREEFFFSFLFVGITGLLLGHIAFFISIRTQGIKCRNEDMLLTVLQGMMCKGSPY